MARQSLHAANISRFGSSVSLRSLKSIGKEMEQPCFTQQVCKTNKDRGRLKLGQAVWPEVDSIRTMIQ